MKRVLVLFLVVLLVVPLVGCGNSTWTEFTQDVGLAPAPTPSPVAVAVLLDVSRGSTASEPRLGATLDALLPVVASRGGSVTVWVLGRDTGTTRPLVRVTRALPKKATRAEGERWVSTARTTSLAGSTGAFGLPASRRSPLLEGITKTAAALREEPGTPLLVVLGDGREVGLFDIECSPPPAMRIVHRVLDREGALRPGSLTGMKVILTFLDGGPVDPHRTCTASLRQDQAIRDLWRTVLHRAGATPVIRAGALQPKDAE